MSDPLDPPCAHCGRPKADHAEVRVASDSPAILICPRSIYGAELAFHSIGDGLEADFEPKL